MVVFTVESRQAPRRIGGTPSVWESTGNWLAARLEEKFDAALTVVPLLVSPIGDSSSIFKFVAIFVLSFFCFPL